MSQSLSAVYLHLVFSTKLRRPYFRDKQLRDALHEYLGGISKAIDCPPIVVGGVEDHVHILAYQARTVTQSDWVKELKRGSNLWLKSKEASFEDFQWQNGYAVFSVSQSNLDTVKTYVQEQEAHHQKFDFQTELRKLLERHQLHWNE